MIYVLIYLFTYKPLYVHIINIPYIAIFILYTSYICTYVPKYNNYSYFDFFHEYNEYDLLLYWLVHYLSMYLCTLLPLYLFT